MSSSDRTSTIVVLGLGLAIAAFFAIGMSTRTVAPAAWRAAFTPRGATEAPPGRVVDATRPTGRPALDGDGGASPSAGRFRDVVLRDRAAAERVLPSTVASRPRLHPRSAGVAYVPSGPRSTVSGHDR
jgi:hypothetical protein